MHMSGIEAALANGYPITKTFPVDGCPAMTVWYDGPSANQASATLEVNSSGDLLFKDGDAGSEAAVVEIKLPTGGTAGTIDVSDASANTFAEDKAHIEASGVFRCKLHVPPSWISNDALMTKAAAVGNLLKRSGQTLLLDTSTAVTTTEVIQGVGSKTLYCLPIAIGPIWDEGLPPDERGAYPDQEGGPLWVSELERVVSMVDNAGDADSQWLCVIGVDKDGNERKILDWIKAGAHEAEHMWPAAGAGPAKVRSYPGEELIVVLGCETVPTSGYIQVMGRTAQFGERERISYRRA